MEFGKIRIFKAKKITKNYQDYNGKIVVEKDMPTGEYEKPQINTKISNAMTAINVMTVKGLDKHYFHYYKSVADIVLGPSKNSNKN